MLVVGQVARDLVLEVDELPEAGGATTVRSRRELLGGKGANQALGLHQLAGAGGRQVSLLGVAGADDAGTQVVEQARSDGLDVRGVVRRGATALMVDVVEPDGTRHLLEHVSPEALLTECDVREAAEAGLFDVDWVSIQLQQPAEAVLGAVQLARSGRARVALDGGAPPSVRDSLLRDVDVVRADAVEARSWSSAADGTTQGALAAAQELLDAGPTVVALAVPDAGDLVAWDGGHRLLPHGDDPVVDPTGAGDAFVAGLLTALMDGQHPEDAAHAAHRAAARTVGHAGGRPDLARTP